MVDGLSGSKKNETQAKITSIKRWQHRPIFGIKKRRHSLKPKQRIFEHPSMRERKTFLAPLNILKDA